MPAHRTTVADEESAHKDCLDRIRQLLEENELLRKSADEFAALAERLQRELLGERRRNTGAAGHGATGDEAGHVRAISMQIEAEFGAIPNLRLTRWQAARLWDLEQGVCDEAIAELVRKRVLLETPSGFMRRDR